MTDSEILAMWQGWKNHTTLGWCRPIDNSGSWFAEVNVPDYLNDDTAAMSLLDTLVEKGFEPTLQYHKEMGWWIDITKEIGYWADTRREAVVTAVLALIGKEGV